MKKCVECAFKHVADAKKTYSELCMGYGQDASHVANFSADMSHAAQHLYEFDLDMANRLRDARLAVLDQVCSDVGALQYRPPFEEFEQYLFKAMKEVVRDGKANSQAGADASRPARKAKGGSRRNAKGN